MKNKLLILLFCCLAGFPPLHVFAQEAKNDTRGIISTPLANVRSDTKAKSPIITQLLMGDEVRILGKQDNRYRIAILTQDRREGWVQQEAVLVPKGKNRDYLNAKRQWIVITKPKSDALILDKTGNHKVALYAGTRLPALKKGADRYEVQFPDRSVAVIKASDAMPEKPLDPLVNDTKAEEIVNTAKQFLHVQYFAGGVTAQGIDMQGLIYVAYRVHGFFLGMDGDALLAKTRKIQKKDLEPGDILLFHGNGMGLYLGSGRFLQTTRKGSVGIAGIHDRRASHALLYGLRIIGAKSEEKKKLADMTADEILIAQTRVAPLAVGQRIAYWAGRFTGTPYDTDPLGLYVRTGRIIADEKADCMYHVFRSVELAQSNTPAEAVDKALTLRFIMKGALADGLVVNYNDRFQYGEDMVVSGKWGRDITAALGPTQTITGSRGRDQIDILPKNVLATRALQKNLQDGDIIYWVKDPRKRAVDEIVGHLSIVRIKSGKVSVIHASGDKDRPSKRGGGTVKEVLFSDYLKSMRFIGAFVTRFE